ncbi:thymidylate synthase, partial [Bacillus sp. B-TM1]
MKHAENEYLNLCRHVMEHGTKKEDRTGTGTVSVFGYQMRFDLSKGFPLLTTKRVPFRLVASELLWFMKGDTNIRYLLQHNNNICSSYCTLNSSSCCERRPKSVMSGPVYSSLSTQLLNAHSLQIFVIYCSIIITFGMN